MKTGKILFYSGIAVLLIFVTGPLLWGIRTSFAPRFDTGIIPSSLTWEHYLAIFGRPEFFTYIKNSLLITLSTICAVLLFAFPAGYALSRLKFPGIKLGVVLLILPLLPPVAILVPLSAYIQKLGIYNTHFAVIITNMVFTLPFSIWMTRNFILANPVEIEEAALIDGCSRFQIIFRIAIPMMVPGLIALSMFVFISVWNNYLYAFALTSSQNLRVLPQGILSYLGTWGTYWGGLTAAGIIAILPPLALFFMFQKWFIEGMFAQQLK